MPRPSWLPPPVVPGAADAIQSPPVTEPLVRFVPGSAADRQSGNAGANALRSWPLMPDTQPHSQPDVTAQQPWNLRNARRLSPAFARIPSLVGGGVDWLALLQSLFDELLYHIDDKINAIVQPFSVGAAATVIRPDESRRYFFIMNTHAAQGLFIGFGFAPTAATGVPLAAGIAYEPLKVPQNEIQLLGTGAATTGVIVYAN